MGIGDSTQLACASTSAPPLLISTAISSLKPVSSLVRTKRLDHKIITLTLPPGNVSEYALILPLYLPAMTPGLAYLSALTTLTLIITPEGV